MSVASNLQKALDIIHSPDRWCQGSLENFKGQNCAIGAVSKAITGNFIPLETQILREVSALWAALPSEYRVRTEYKCEDLTAEERTLYSEWNGVVMFNNSHPYEDVRALFETAIKRQLIIEQMAEDGVVEVSEPVFLDEIPGAAMEEADRVYQQEVSDV